MFAEARLQKRAIFGINCRTRGPEHRQPLAPDVRGRFASGGGVYASAFGEGSASPGLGRERLPCSRGGMLCQRQGPQTL